MGKGQELLEASREGDRRTVEKILGQITKRSGPFPSLRRGAGVNVQDDNGYTPLHHACLRGHKDIVRLLLSVDASPCMTDKKGATPLHLAAWKGDSDVVSMLLSHNNPPVNIDQLTSDQESALLIAAQFGNVDVAAQLLAKGADVTIRNIKNETALDLAAQYGRLETVRHLLRARPQLVEEYRHHMYKPSTPLHRASKNGHKEVVATLIAAGIDPNVKTSNGTALHEAAYYGKASVVKVLLAKGADPNARDRLGKTVYDVLNDYPEEATKNIRRILRDYEKTNGYESEEDLPPFPVNDYSPTGYPSSGIMNTQETTPSLSNNLSLSPSSSSITKTSQSFVKKLACKLGIKSKCSSAPNIFNTSESDILIRKYEQNKSNTNTIVTGNSKFFKILSKKEETGDIVCNDEFDTISLDRLPNLDRATAVNRSNRSCPGFKVSLPNISENAELSDTESTDSIEITELNCNETVIENKISPKPRRGAPLAIPEAVNLYPDLSIFEPRNHDSNPRSSDDSTTSANAVNDYYESYDFLKTSSVQTVDLIPKPPPRPSVASKNIVRGTLYENVVIENNVVRPTPAARIRPAPPPPIQAIKKDNTNEQVEPQIKIIPDVPKRTVIIADKENCNISSSISTSSLSSDSSMEDESNLEDILLSKKSTSFKHRTKISIRKTTLDRSQSIASVRSDITEASAIENVDCSADPNDKSISTTGTLPNKKSQEAIKTKKLFRHKTFTDIKADRNSLKDLKLNSEFLKETLASYHIRGTGHCIYKAPTVQEFINIFNQEALYEDVDPMHDTTNKRESYYETAICFCKPKPKFHNSADDLLDITNNEDKVTIDLDALRNRQEIMATTFQCFCDSNHEPCKFHLKNRQNSSNLVVKFSAINKSISTPNITLISTFTKPKSPGLPKNKSVPDHLEDPSSITNYESVQFREKEKLKQMNSVTSYTSQISTSSSVSQQYSVKDISDAISDSTLTSNSSLQRECQRQSNSSGYSFWSLKSSDSNVTVRSNISYKSCLEDISSDDETLHCDSDSDTDTIKSDAETVNSDVDTMKSDVSESKRPWVSSDSFRFGNKKPSDPIDVIKESDEVSESDGSLVASLERGSPVVGCSGSVRRRWEETEGASEGDALSVSSAASSCAAHHYAHHHEYNKVSPTPPKKPPRRNLSVSPTHANSPSSGSYSYDLRTHARSQDDLDDLQGPKQHLRHGRSIDQYVDSKLSYSEYEENHSTKAPVPHPRPSLKPRVQPIAITTMYENVCIKEQNPRRKLKRNSFGQSDDKRERSSLESLLDESPSDYERYYDGNKIEIPLSPSHYNQPPTPEHPPPSAKIAENSIHERIRPLSQEYKRRSALRDSYTEVEMNLLRVASAVSVASGATDRSRNTDCVEEFVCDVPFAGLFKGSTTTLDGIGLRPMPAERPKTLRKLKSVYDTSPTEAPTARYQHTTSNGQDRSNGIDEEVRRRSGTTSSNQSTEKSLSILSPFDEQEEWAKISEIMASFGSKLVRESVFVSELEQEFTSRLGLSCSESSLSPSVSSNLGLWLAGIGLHEYESLLLDAGFDDLDFINGVLEESDLKELGIEEADRIKILEATRQLPMKITEISNNHNNNSLLLNRPNDTVEHWLKSIHLDNYTETFRKHLYNDMDRVRRIWEVELTAVLEIQKLGHRRRILASVSGQNNGPSTNIEDINADLNNLKNNIKQLKEEIKEKMPHSENLKSVPPPVVPPLAPGGETLKRSKKNRPAPQPPRPSDLEIRAPSELLVGVPGALKTQWKHQPFVLVTGAVTYKANYLGSTVVKELRGTESTKKSIQKLKKNNREPRDSPDIILSISYRGVKFLNTSTLELICEHEIRNIHCACQDADDLTHFAYITKDHTTKSHYCHVFCVATMDQATEVILTLGEAFEVAYQMALREQAIRPKVPYGSQPQTKTPTHDPTTTSHREKVNVNHGRSHSITEIKLNGHQLKIAPIPSSLSNEDFQSVRGTDSSRSPLGLLKAPIASTEEL